MQKLLTLAVPTYNMELYIERCLRSVVCDNMDYLEVLVVNDGSKDRSSEIAHQIEAQYPSVIRVIDKENGNYGTCVNRALDEARGKYFRMLDSDDWVNTEALNQLLEQMKSCDADLIISQSEDRDPEGNLIRRMGTSDQVEYGKIYDAKTLDCLSVGYMDLFCSHLLTYKTEILRKIGLRLQAGISYTDNEYVFYPLDRIESLVFFDLPLYQYFVGREGQTTQPQIINKSIGQIKKVLDGLLSYYYQNKEHNSNAVLHNQGIVITEMFNWLYWPIFLKPYTEEKCNLLLELETHFNKEDVFRELFRNDINVWFLNPLDYYRKTGKYMPMSFRLHIQLNKWVWYTKVYYRQVMRKTASLIKENMSGLYIVQRKIRGKK